MKVRGRRPVRNAKPSRVLKFDPSRTLTIRRAFAAKLRRQFGLLKGRIVKLVGDEDAFALNTRFRFNTDPDKIRAFQSWLAQQYGTTLTGRNEESLWRRFIEEGFKKGAGRAFDDTSSRARALAAGDQQKLDFYAGTRDQFLRSAFGRPETVEKVQLLAGRAFDELDNVTSDMSNKMSRVLADGLVQGRGPRDIARNLADEVDIGRARAELIAQTELIRAHAEGQLTALDELGVEEVGVAVEWSTAGDERVCPNCADLEGVVLKIDEARGMLPRHPGCRCSFLPANVGESDAGQKTTKTSIDRAIKSSAGGDDWGPGRAISKTRPESVVNEWSSALVAFSRFLAENEGNCGVGAGGFQPGNTCAKGDGTEGKSKFTGAKVGAEVHAHAESVKNLVAKVVGGLPEELTSDPGQKDKKPYDVKVPGGGRGDHDIEVKSMTVGGKQSISVHEDALLRKVEHVAANPKNTFHTVAVDDRETYNGGANKENYSGHRLYYRRGSGRYALSQMHPVKDEAELARLIKTPDSKLPEKARGHLPPPPPVKELREKAASASEARKSRDKARKERNKDVLREQARARAARAKAAKGGA